MGLVPGAPCIGRPCGALGAAARGGGAVYTGRGPVCGVIILLCCAIGCPGTGLVDGGPGVACWPAAAVGGAAAGFGGAASGGVTTTLGGCAGGVTTTAAGVAGLSTGAGGGATTAGAAGLTAGGVTTALLSAAGAAGLGVTAVGFSAAGGAAAGAVAFGGAGEAAGVAETAGGLAGGAEGCCCCCSLSLSSLATSPGLEIFERSIFGLTSVADAFSREDEPDLAEKCFRTRSASSSSIELEWVFFSVTPTASSTSRIALLLTSSSLARSLIRIFIRSLFPPGTFTRS
jgi:hypothetical protein